MMIILTQLMSTGMPSGMSPSTCLIMVQVCSNSSYFIIIGRRSLAQHNESRADYSEYGANIIKDPSGSRKQSRLP